MSRDTAKPSHPVHQNRMGTLGYYSPFFMKNRVPHLGAWGPGHPLGRGQGTAFLFLRLSGSPAHDLCPLG
jgi:hypothetical protein